MKRPTLACLLLLAGLSMPLPAHALPQKLVFTPETGPSAAIACPPDARRLSVGEDIAGIVGRSLDGQSFCIGAGIHRLQEITPKNRQKFFGEQGAILSGARLLTDFTREGRYYVAEGQDQEGERRSTEECLKDYPRCSYPEMLFFDDRPLKHVPSLAAVTNGAYYFDYDEDRIYFLDDPAGRKVEVSVLPSAFEGGAKDVVVTNLTIEKYASPIQLSALGGSILPERWTIDHNEVRWNYAVGIGVGSNTLASHNYVHSNGEMGFGGVGRDIIVEANEIAFNGYFAGLDPSWEGGGGKFALTENLMVRGNYSHDNNGLGLWTDIDNYKSTYVGNRVERNLGGGISHEISYDAVITGNSLVGNGTGTDTWLWGGGVILQNSQNVEVTGNYVETLNGGNGISLIQQDRGKGARGPYLVRGNTVTGNLVIYRYGEGVTGMDTDDTTMRPNHGNVFDGNTYVVPDLNHPMWMWDDPMTWNQFRARGFEQHGAITDDMNEFD